MTDGPLSPLSGQRHDVNDAKVVKELPVVLQAPSCLSRACLQSVAGSSWPSASGLERRRVDWRAVSATGYKYAGTWGGKWK